MKKIFFILLCFSFFVTQAQFKFKRSKTKSAFVNALVEAQLNRNTTKRDLKTLEAKKTFLKKYILNITEEKTDEFSSKFEELVNSKDFQLNVSKDVIPFLKKDNPKYSIILDNIVTDLAYFNKIVINTDATRALTEDELYWYNNLSDDYIIAESQYIRDSIYLQELISQKMALIEESDYSHLEKNLPILTKKINNTTNTLDSLSKVLRQEIYKAERGMFSNRNSKWFPNSKVTQYILDLAYGENGTEGRFFSTTGVSLGINSSSVYSELYNDRFRFFRVGFGVMVNKSTADSIQEAQTDEAYQRLLTAGGNTVLNLDYPYVYHKSRNDGYHGIGFFNIRVAADLPDFGSSTDDFLAYFSPGVNYYGEFSTKRDVFKFFFDVTGRYFFGGENFRDNLELSKKSFGILKLDVGVQVNNLFAISLTPISVATVKNFRNNRVVLSLKMIN